MSLLLQPRRQLLNPGQPVGSVTTRPSGIVHRPRQHVQRGLAFAQSGRFLSVAGICFFLSSCSSAEPDTLVGADKLERVRTVVRQDATAETVWLSRPSALHYDEIADRLFALDRDNQRAVEFTTSGEFVGAFGGRGEGPGEMRNVKAVAAIAATVVVLDQGNSKLLFFDRDTRELMTEVRLRGRVPVNMSTAGDTAVAVIPGPNGSLFELFSLEGLSLGAFGDGGFLGNGYPGHLVADIGYGRLVVVKPELPEGRIYRLDGSPLDIFVFSELGHVLAEWREAFAAKVRRRMGSLAAADAGRIAAGKLYVSSLGAAGDGSFFVAVTPEDLDINPPELWLLDRRGRVKRRYVFDRPWVGRLTASFPRIFAAGQEDEYGIHEYRIP